MAGCTVAEVEELFALPFNELLYRAHSIHRTHFDPNAVQISTLLSIKTGGCPEDCAYCPQSVRYQTEVKDEPLMSLPSVISAARRAKSQGATRFCMGAAWRGPKQKDLEPVLDMIKAVRELGLETCATLGLLQAGQAKQLAAAGLSDQVTLMSLNVFGRTIGPGNTDGRQHNPNHQVSITIGKPFKGGIIGGVAPLGTDYGALAIDSKSGAASASGDVSALNSLAAFGQTMLAAVGVSPAIISSEVATGAVVTGALA